MRNRTLLLIFLGIVIGVPLGALVSRMTIAHAEMPSTIRTKLYRFELINENLSTFDEWVKFEHDNHRETIATLEREHMYFEAIFRDRKSQPNVIYWLAASGEHGATGETSHLPIDAKYRDFMRATLKKGSRKELDTEYVLIPDFIEAAVKAHHPVP